jgi:uncharacterized protein (TIGR03118 family)
MNKTAVIQATTPGANYTGLAISQAPEPRLFAAKAGGIDVFNGSFQPVNLGSGAFATPAAISALNLVPFNVQNIGGAVHVTYAPAGLAAQRNAAPGARAVAIFDVNGSLLRPPMVGGQLAAPWGITSRPAQLRSVQQRPAGRQFQLHSQRDQRLRSDNRDVRGHDPD